MDKLFFGVRGQSRAVSILSTQLKSGKLSHAYLFLGKEGSGKEFIAREFSKYILCGANKIDNCLNCVKFAKDIHPDFMHIDGQSVIKIEDIRKSIERINLSPNLSRKKVLLITGVENMGIEAANALLKTIEEPPTDSVIILTAITEKSLPETIVSRSQRIKLNVLKKDDVQLIISEKFGENNLEKIIELSGGSINKAMEMAENSDSLNYNQTLSDDVNILFQSKSIIEKFKIIEKYDKEKNMKLLLDEYSKVLFRKVAVIISNNDDASRYVDIGKETLKIYSNLDYNVSLRISLEKIILKEHVNV